MEFIDHLIINSKMAGSHLAADFMVKILRHKWLKKSFSSIFWILLLMVQSCSPAMQEVDSLMKYINAAKKEIRENPSEERKQAVFTRARKRFLAIIDTDFVAQLSLGPYFDKLTEQEKKDFTGIFYELMAYNLVKTYIPIGTIVEDNITVELMMDEVKKDKLFGIEANIIHTRFSNKKVWYYIDFYLHKVGKRHKLYDVHVDGASVLMDYRHQFETIISTKGFPYLLERLKEKYKNLDQG